MLFELFWFDFDWLCVRPSLINTTDKIRVQFSLPKEFSASLWYLRLCLEMCQQAVCLLCSVWVCLALCLIKLVNRRCCYVWIWRLVGSTIQSKEEEKTLHFAPCTQLYSCHFNAQVLAWEPASATLMHKSFVPPPHLRHTGGKAGKITSYSPASVSLGGGVNVRFHFFAQKVGGWARGSHFTCQQSHFHAAW